MIVACSWDAATFVRITEGSQGQAPMMSYADVMVIRPCVSKRQCRDRYVMEGIGSILGWPARAGFHVGWAGPFPPKPETHRLSMRRRPKVSGTETGASKGSSINDVGWIRGSGKDKRKISKLAASAKDRKSSTVLSVANWGPLEVHASRWVSSGHAWALGGLDLKDYRWKCVTPPFWRWSHGHVAGPGDSLSSVWLNESSQLDHRIVSCHTVYAHSWTWNDKHLIPGPGLSPLGPGPWHLGASAIDPSTPTCINNAVAPTSLVPPSVPSEWRARMGFVLFVPLPPLDPRAIIRPTPTGLGCPVVPFSLLVSFTKSPGPLQSLADSDLVKHGTLHPHTHDLLPRSFGCYLFITSSLAPSHPFCVPLEYFKISATSCDAAQAVCQPPLNRLSDNSRQVSCNGDKA
ncbi:hypothetical protein LIA77_00392 [Sarocladium implicatum]|nr:hypothetical protein LIA77_00392 [Sarocladium implicatum]